MAVFTAISTFMGMKAAKQQKKAQREQQRQQNLAARRSRTQDLRQAQIAQANGAGLGVAETSGLRGGLAANQAQLGEGLGFSTQMSGLSQNVSMFQQKAADFRSYGQLASGLAGLTYKAVGASGIEMF